LAILHHLLALLAAALAIVAAGVSLQAPAWPTAFASPAPAPRCIGRSVLDIQPFHDGQRFAHAVSAAVLRDGRLRAVWYGGPKELSPHVKLWTAIFDGTQWSAAQPIVGPAEVSAGTGRYVRKLGNPIIYRDAAGELVIVFSGIAFGGWPGVSLKIIRSTDEGETWSPARNLTTTAIFNLGTNVRGPAIPAAGNVTLVPTSHEFLRTFPEVVLLNGRGRVVGKRRIGVSFGGFQPFVTVLDEHRAIAFMRVHRGFILSAKTGDAAASWTDPAPTTSPTRNTPVVATPIGDQLFMVSSQLDRTRARWSLILAMSADQGQSWRNIFAQQFGDSPLALPKYPWLSIGSDGLFHLLFTYVRDDDSTQLMHARISRDWIAEHGGPACP